MNICAQLHTYNFANINLCPPIGYPLSYSNDLHFGKEIYAIPNNVESIQSEIMMNGPITVGFTVYEDLLCYGSGEYNFT